MRALAVIVAALIGAAAGFALAGGSLGAAAADPEVLTASGTGPLLGMVAGALALPWLVNRWVEHDPRR